MISRIHSQKSARTLNAKPKLLAMLLCAAAPWANACPVDGATYTFSAPPSINFGTNTATVEWLGGVSGSIETATAGTALVDISALTNWSTAIESDTDVFTKVTTATVWSGSKSLVADSTDYLPSDDGRFGVSYDTGGTITDQYLSYYVYFDAGTAEVGQWKMLRWGATDAVTDNADGFNIFMANWEGAGWDFITIQGEGSTRDFTGGELPPAGGWYRVEVRMQPSSAANTSDGTIYTRVRRMSDKALVCDRTFSGVNLYSGATRARYLTFQNYQGNNDYGSLSATKVFMDDIYISNTPKRVELGDAATYAGSTQFEVQKFTSWSNSSITITVNKGGFSSLNGKYLYVIGADNNPINTNGIALQ